MCEIGLHTDGIVRLILDVEQTNGMALEKPLFTNPLLSFKFKNGTHKPLKTTKLYKQHICIKGRDKINKAVTTKKCEPNNLKFIWYQHYSEIWFVKNF